MRRVLIVLSLISTAIPVLSQSASACSCVPATRKELARYAEVVFTGVVETVVTGETSFATTFAVGVTYKGRPIERRYIHSGTQEGACGIRFDEATKYTVFAERLNDGRLWTSICSGNKKGPIRHARYGLPRGERV